MSDPEAKKTRDEALEKLKEDITKWAGEEKKDLENELKWLKAVRKTLKDGTKTSKAVSDLKTQYTKNLQVKDFI